MDVGVRELRDHLRRYLEDVADGHEITVTERGRPIARLIGVSSPSTRERLIAAGIVTAAERPKKGDRTFPRVKSKGSVSELVREQRR